MSAHEPTANVASLLLALERANGWTGTAALCLTCGLDDNVGRRILRELAECGWVRHVAPAGEGDRWCVGPRLTDLADHYELLLLQRAWVTHALWSSVRGVRAELMPIVPAFATHELREAGHKATRAVHDVAVVLLAAGGWCSTSRVREDARIHRDTCVAILTELSSYGIAERATDDLGDRWQIGPTLARIGRGWERAIARHRATTATTMQTLGRLS